jgi:hypothetical protein
MGETIPTVFWALDYHCDIRNESESQEPQIILDRLFAPWIYAHAFRDHELLDSELLDSDICVYNYVVQNDRLIPYEGFSATEELEKYGGRNKLHEMCGMCPANALMAASIQVVGCFGWLQIPYNSFDSIESYLESFLALRNLQEDFQQHFLRTHPALLGLWAQSPLNFSQAMLLATILENFPSVKHIDSRQIQDFAVALRVSVERNLPMRVYLTPPGHADEGWRSVLPHCPRCKMWPSVDVDWSKSTTCQSCGYDYIPDSTASRKPDTFIARRFKRISELVPEIPATWTKPYSPPWEQQ